MLNIFEIAYDKTTPFRDKVQYVESLTHLQSFVDEDSKTLENVSNKIKLLLGSSQTRLEGLLLVHTILSQCSTEIFSENAVIWAQSAIKILQSTDGSGNKQLACTVLISIINHLPSFPDLWRQAASSVLPVLLELLIKTSPEDEWITVATECLAICMQKFPGPCGPNKSNIDHFLLTQLDSWLCRSLEPVALCFAHLPACGGGGNQSINYVNAWQEQLQTMMNTLHLILNILYDGVEAGDQEHSITSVLDFIPVPENPLSSVFKQAHRFQGISQCIAKMLSSQYSVKVKIPVEALLTLVCRTLSVTTSILVCKPSTDIATIASVLPSIHSAAVTILESLILCLSNVNGVDDNLLVDIAYIVISHCHKHLIGHGSLILNLLVGILKTTASEKKSYGAEKPFSMLRSTTYRVLQVWLTKLHSSSSIELYADKLVQELLNDIQPDVSMVKLHGASHGLMKAEIHKNQKRKKSNQMADFQRDSLGERKINYLANSLTCTEALRTLKCLLYVGSSFLKPDIHKGIHEAIMKLLLEIQQKPQDSPVPYNNAICRLELYAVLLAALVSSHPQALPPLQSSIHSFSVGQRECNVMVSEFCIQALAVCNSIIHPRVQATQAVPVLRKMPSPNIKVPFFPPTMDQHLNGEIVTSDPSKANWAWSSNRPLSMFHPPNKQEYVEFNQTNSSQEPPSDIHTTPPCILSNGVVVSDNTEEQETVCVANGQEMIIGVLPSQEDNESVEAESEENYSEEERADSEGQCSDGSEVELVHNTDTELPYIIRTIDPSEVKHSINHENLQDNSSDIRVNKNHISKLNDKVPEEMGNLQSTIDNDIGQELNSMTEIQIAVKNVQNSEENVDMEVKENGVESGSSDSEPVSEVVNKQTVDVLSSNNELVIRKTEKRPLLDVNHVDDGPPPKKAITSEESGDCDEVDIDRMLEDFVPCSPDKIDES